MKININYETTYFFSSNVPRLVQSVMLHPTECTNQKVISCDIATSKGELIEVPKDALGHKLYNIYNKNISEPQTISMKCTVETENHFGVMKGLDESVHPHCFLRQTKLTEPDKKILNIVKMKGKKNSVDFCHSMNEAVAKSIKYVSGSTDIYTSAVDAVSLGTGVCQDFSHILVGLARFHGYPARYVNGFMLDDTDVASRDTHAWAEVFIENLGWVSFDRCHSNCLDEKYVRVGCGYDFSYTSMIKGVKTNFNGNESLNHMLTIDAESSQ